ncbi:MAG: hypothetical protein IPJ69_11110 [Deltaproteobacteria bacterium]|nr:MAG: hypothetical protein IPJ69_11110 [Deltaproteobacteria bacterium]
MKLVSQIQITVNEILEYAEPSRALIVYDDQSALTGMISKAYHEVLPNALSINFDQTPAEKILEIFKTLSPKDLVVLIQSSSFRLDAFRIRVQLFQQGIKVIEYPHLGRVLESEYETYLDSLIYDSKYYRTLGPALKEKLDQSHEVKLLSGDHSLVFGGPMESAKLNIGDYRGMRNVGGQFPIGEVFTELKKLEDLNGNVALFAFGDRDFAVNHGEKDIVLKVEKGRVVEALSSTPEFDAVLEDIRSYEGEVWVRELGFGLNRAFTYEKRVQKDVGIYERMCGVHLSLGGKHAIYPKEGFHKKKVKYHVDVFARTSSVTIDGDVIYKDGSYIIPLSPPVLSDL